MMKQFNVNAIRTAHYPENKLTYELADELGLYCLLYTSSVIFSQ